MVIAHAGIPSLAEAQVEHFGINSDARVLQFASLSFDAFVMEFLMCFATGARLILTSPEKLVGTELTNGHRKVNRSAMNLCDIAA